MKRREPGAGPAGDELFFMQKLFFAFWHNN
jgi:hypothetical protein